MLVIESRFFFHDLFHEKSTFSSLASSGSIRYNFAMSRINWLGNNFFFFFRFFLFFRWNNQKHLLEKFQRLQNAALRTILGAFKTSPIKAMEIKAAVPSPRIRFEKTCYNYTIRIIQMNSMHPIIERVPEDFPLFIGKAEFDSAKFLKWNNLIHPETDNENERIQILDLESDFSNDEIHRKKMKK